MSRKLFLFEKDDPAAFASEDAGAGTAGRSSTDYDYVKIISFTHWLSETTLNLMALPQKLYK
jgi:hypothetical protein